MIAAAFPIAAIIGYLLGTIPFGFLLTRAAGLGDVRSIGSGNIGATNVLRTGRKDIAAATLLLDGAKGAAAVLLMDRLAGPDAALVAAVAAVLGHCTSVWMRGRGGKGVATALGAILTLAWPVGLACLALWLAAVALTRMSSVGSLSAMVSAPALMVWWHGPLPALATIAIAAIVLFRHAGNIRRLLAGTEPRIGAPAPSSPAPSSPGRGLG